MKRPSMTPAEVLAKRTSISIRESEGRTIPKEEYERYEGALDYYLGTGELIETDDGPDLPE